MSGLTVSQGSSRQLSLNESSHLLENNDILINAIFEKCIQNESSIDQHPRIRKVALVLSATASLSAGAFFFPISLRLPAGPVFSTCNFVGYVKLDIWAIRGAINDVLGPKSRYEIILLNRASKGKFYSSVVLISSTVIAILFQIPPSLPAFTYEGSWGLPAFIILVAGGIFIPTRSIQLSINRIFQTRNFCLEQIAKKMERLRQETSSLVDQHQEIFRKMGYGQKLEHVRKMNRLIDNEQRSGMNFVINVLSTPMEYEEQPKSWLTKYAPKIPGTWIAASLWTGVAYYTYEKTKVDFINNDYAAASLAGTTVLLGVYFSSMSIINTAEKMIKYIYNTITCQKEKSISEQIRPKLYMSLHLLGFVIDLGALGSTHVIWGDFFKKKLVASIYFQTTVGLANFLFLTSATIDLVAEVVEEIIHRWGDNNEKEIIDLKIKLSNLQKLLNSSSLLDFGLFITKMPVEKKQILLSKVNLTVQQLDEWLSTKI